MTNYENNRDRLVDTVFANTDFVDEAENYIYNGMTDRDEIADDVRACWNDLHLDFDESDVAEYTDKIMNVIESGV